MTPEDLRMAAERLRKLNPKGPFEEINFHKLAKDAINVAEAYLVLIDLGKKEVTA